MISSAAAHTRTVLDKIGSRNAVETAIELSKCDRKITWEKAVARYCKLIKTWESLAAAKQTEPASARQ
jgi:hypothetical protein